MNNQDIIAAIADLRKAIDLDKHNGVRNFVLKHLLEAKIIDEIPVSTLDPCRDFPANWTATQIAIFDNGEPVADKRKRPTIQRTSMRYGGNIKVWTSDQINFGSKSSVAWAKNFYLWDHTIAVRVAEELMKEGYVDQATVELMRELVNEYGDGAHYAIPLLKIMGAGSRWMRKHIIMVGFDETGMPDRAGVITPDTEFQTNEFADEMANGSSFTGGVIAQARVARNPAFGAWATQLL